MTELEQMLANGATPESIYKEALKIVKKQNEQKAMNEQRKAEIEKVRTKFISAYINYLNTVIGEKVNPESAKVLEKSFIEFENKYARLTQHLSEKPPVKKEQKKRRESVSEDDLKALTYILKDLYSI